MSSDAGDHTLRDRARPTGRFFQTIEINSNFAQRRTWSATEQAGEDAGECGVLERSEGGGRGHSGEESAPIAAKDVQHWRGERWARIGFAFDHTQGVIGFPAAGGFCPLVSPLLILSCKSLRTLTLSDYVLRFKHSARISLSKSYAS